MTAAEATQSEPAAIACSASLSEVSITAPTIADQTYIQTTPRVTIELLFEVASEDCSTDDLTYEILPIASNPEGL